MAGATVAVGAVYLLSRSAQGQNGGNGGPPPPPPDVKLFQIVGGEGFIIPQPDGSTDVAFTVSASGGSLPYHFTYKWGDGPTFESEQAVMTRHFVPGQYVPSTCFVTARSFDGQQDTIDLVATSVV